MSIKRLSIMYEIYDNITFIMEVENIFKISEISDIDNFSEEDYKFLLYLEGHWKRVLNQSVEFDDDILPERLKVEVEGQKIKAQELKSKLFKIKRKYAYLDDKFEFKQLEDFFFYKYESISK